MTNTPNLKSFDVGSTILKQGDDGHAAYIIEEGSVEVYITHPDGSIQSLAKRGAGTIIGEMALVDRQRRTASVRALEPCQMIEINQSEYKRRLDNTDPVMKMVTQVILARYRDTLSRINSFGSGGNYSASEEIERRATSSGKTVEHLKTANEFKEAIGNNELQLYYQPIIDLKNERVKKCEALIRWNHPERGYVSPFHFIPIHRIRSVNYRSNSCFRLNNA